MTLLVHTTRIGSPFARSREDVLDITARSGCELGKAFAPSWRILRPAINIRAQIKQATMRGLVTTELERELRAAWDVYGPAYHAEMRASWRANRRAWEKLLSSPTRTLVCYCAPDVDGELRCHRVILAHLLERTGRARYDGER